MYFSYLLRCVVYLSVFASQPCPHCAPLWCMLTYKYRSITYGQGLDYHDAIPPRLLFLSTKKRNDIMLLKIDVVFVS